MKIELSNIEKKILCIEFAKHIPKIRDLLHLTQKQFGAMCGISTDRLSRIENEHTTMTWSQLISIMFVCFVNISTKEYLFANDVFSERFYQYFQQVDENIPPIINVIVRDEIINEYALRKGEEYGSN